MDIGTALRDARQCRGLTLRDVSASTKLSMHVLGAIEQNDLQHLPGGLFVRGHLRAYAREVGLDAELVVSEYLAQNKAPPEEEEESLQRLRVRYASSGRHQSPGPRLALVAVAIVFLIYGLHDSTRVDSPTAEDLAFDAIPSGEELGSVVHPPTAPVGALASTEAGIELEIQPVGLCWISALADGKRVISRLLQPGERAVVDAQETIVLRVGDPGAFRYWINGAEGRPIGRAAQAVTVEITADNYQRFLSSFGDSD